MVHGRSRMMGGPCQDIGMPSTGQPLFLPMALVPDGPRHRASNPTPPRLRPSSNARSRNISTDMKLPIVTLGVFGHRCIDQMHTSVMASGRMVDRLLRSTHQTPRPRQTSIEIPGATTIMQRHGTGGTAPFPLLHLLKEYGQRLEKCRVGMHLDAGPRCQLLLKLNVSEG